MTNKTTEAECEEYLDEYFGDDPAYAWAINAIEYQIKEIAQWTGAKVQFGRGQACMILYKLIEGGYLQEAIIERKSDGWVSIQHLPADDVIAVQAQEIARLRELHNAVKIVVTEHKEVMNKNNWRACQCKVCLIFAALLMGDSTPAAK